MSAYHPDLRPEASAQLDYVLRRAEQESIAAIRSTCPAAAERHDAMAHAYSALAVMILADPENGQATMIKASRLPMNLQIPAPN